MKKITFILLVFLLTSCSSQYIIRYQYTTENYSPKDNAIFEKTLFGRYNLHYLDNELELYFDFAPYEIGLFIKNLKSDTLRIIWDKVYLETDFNKTEKFRLTHTNREQEYLSLNNKKNDNYEKIKIIKRLQQQDKSYKVQPTIILPGDNFIDRLVNSEKKDFYPYVINKNESFDIISKDVENKTITLFLPVKINNKLKKLSFTIKISDINIIKMD